MIWDTSKMDIDQRGAYFLCRFSHRNNLYKEEAGKLVKFGLMSELMKAMAREDEILCEFDVWFQKNGRKVKMRLTCEIVPEEVAEDRRKNARKVARKKGRKPTRKHLFFLGWNLYNQRREDHTGDKVSRLRYAGM